MLDEERWEMWRNANAEIKKPYGGSFHKHIVWYQGADRRKAFLDGLAEGRNSYLGCETPMNQNYMFMYSVLLKENEQLKEKLEHRNCIDCLITESRLKF